MNALEACRGLPAVFPAQEARADALRAPRGDQSALFVEAEGLGGYAELPRCVGGAEGSMGWAHFVTVFLLIPALIRPDSGAGASAFL